MELKNIHNKQDFLQVYELFGGSEGGAGTSDGFANNAKLKDTYLGALINGIFKGIGWLWRKSKENFIINRLNAQLINELMRGVILFCFENNIDLKTGKQANVEEKIKENPHKNAEDEDDVEKDHDEDVVEPVTLSKEELEKKIIEYSGNVKTCQNNISTTKNQIKKDETESNSLTNPKDIKIKQEKIDRLKKQLHEQEVDLKDNEEKLAKCRKDLSNISSPPPTPATSLNDIDKACKDKYDFIPTSENLPDNLPDFSDMGYISVPEYQEKMQDDKKKTKKYKIKYIKIGDQFKIVNEDGKLENIKVYDVDTNSGKIIYIDSKSTNKEIYNSKLLNKDFPGYGEIKKTCLNFLNNHVSEYNSMTDEDKVRLETIFMQYKLIDELSKIQKSALTKESVEYLKLNEESIGNTVSTNLASAGTSKFKPDEPQAGKVSLDKSIGMKLAGDSATVGDILTIRDRKKYPEKKELFNIDIHDVNLAEIEKTIVQLEKNQPESDIKLKVSSYVNPYNLATIKIAADQLLASTPEKNNAALKLRWDKTISKTYAAFTLLMNISKVNIIKSDYGNELNNNKVDDKAGRLTETIGDQIEDAPVLNKLPLIEDEKIKYVNYNKLSEGWWCYYSFKYNKLYKTTIAPVSAAFNKGFGLAKFTSYFKTIDDVKKVIDIDENFKKNFISLRTDDAASYSDKDVVNVYMLFKKGQKFPNSNTPYPIKIFILNEFIKGGKSYLYLKKVGNNPSVTINKNIVSSVSKNYKDYIFNCSSQTVRNFKKGSEVEPWKKAFKFEAPYKNDFRLNMDKLAFESDADIMNYIQKLSDILNK